MCQALQETLGQLTIELLVLPSTQRKQNEFESDPPVHVRLGRQGHAQKAIPYEGNGVLVVRIARKRISAVFQAVRETKSEPNELEEEDCVQSWTANGTAESSEGEERGAYALDWASFLTFS